MGFNLFSFFSQKKQDLVVPDSLLLKQIKSLAKHSHIEVFSNIEIFHHTTAHAIELLLYDNTRGIYLFEIKRWSFDDLKNATIQKAEHQERSSNTLAFEKTQDVIKQKFNEVLHNDGVAIFNYLLMENLSALEYEHLDDSFKALLPQEKIIFNDSSTSDIFKKLESAAPPQPTMDISYVMGTLLTQYTIIDNQAKLHLCDEDQRSFIDGQTTSSLSVLQGDVHTGKSSLLLLRALYSVFKQKSKKVVIIKPTILARDIAYKKLLEIIEYGIVEIDPASIEILTPLELINKHLQKLKKPVVNSLAMVEPKLLQKSYNDADMILCDDAFALEKKFIDFIKHIQKNKSAVFVNLDNTHAMQCITLQHNYLNESFTLHTLQTQPYAKAMQLLHTITQRDAYATVLIICNQETYEHLQEDLENFIEPKTSQVNADLNLLEQNYNTIQLTTYNAVYDLDADFIIALDTCEQVQSQLTYALHRANKEAYLLYEEPCETLQKFLQKDTDENNQE